MWRLSPFLSLLLSLMRVIVMTRARAVCAVWLLFTTDYPLSWDISRSFEIYKLAAHAHTASQLLSSHVIEARGSARGSAGSASRKFTDACVITEVGEKHLSIDIGKEEKKREEEIC